MGRVPIEPFRKPPLHLWRVTFIVAQAGSKASPKTSLGSSLVAEGVFYENHPIKLLNFMYLYKVGPLVVMTVEVQPAIKIIVHNLG